MWRRFGDLAFAALVAIVITVEAIPLVWLTWMVVGHVGGVGPTPGLPWVLLGAVSTAGAGLVVITAYLLALQSMSARREAASAEARARWVARWLGVLAGSAAPPAPPVPREAVEALLELRDVLRGAESERLLELMQGYGIGEALADRARGRRLARRLQAFEDLARARAPEAMPTLLAAVIDPDRRVQVAAARAAARTLAAVGAPGARDELAGTLVRALQAAGLPFGVLEEVLLLADEAAPAMVGEILGGEASPAFLRAALDAVGRLGLLDHLDRVVEHLGHPDPEVRAAALRAAARLAVLPPDGRPAVRAALADPVEFVRIHAAAAAALLPREEALPALWELLGDPSWWVRRAAADALARLGRSGLAALGRAAGSHPDRYARDMAAQVLRDHVEQVVEAIAG